MNPPSTTRLKLRLSPAAEKAVRQGHPWIYANRVRQQNRTGDAGEFAVVYDRRDRFLAIGLYDPDSPIAVRVVHAGSPVQIDDPWWTARMAQPLRKRRELFAGQSTTGYRCINGESDGWPGLILDRYADCAVLKLYSAAWFPHVERIVGLIQTELQPGHLVLRLSRNSEDAAAKYNLHDGKVLCGTDLKNPVVFEENGLRFEADILRGQKTGFFLDQRDNRKRVGELATGRDVLNVFSHAGAFSVYAAAGGARSTADLDISELALQAADRNMELNKGNGRIAACPHETIKADAFQWLSTQPSPRYDLIITDPPSLAKRESEKEGALAAYEQLAMEGLRLLRPGGILVSASCSSHVGADEFFELARNAARRSRVRTSELKTTRHAGDHPATIPEAHYLKCIYLKKI